jgi:hypothetical protein
VTVTGRGSADEAVVVVKLGADEDTVTYLRGKLSASGTRERVLEAKGGTCNRDFQKFYLELPSRVQPERSSC